MLGNQQMLWISIKTRLTATCPCLFQKCCPVQEFEIKIACANNKLQQQACSFCGGSILHICVMPPVLASLTVKGAFQVLILFRPLELLYWAPLVGIPGETRQIHSDCVDHVHRRRRTNSKTFRKQLKSTARK